LDYKNKILQLLNINNGLITTSQIVAQGIPKVYLTRMIRQGLIERVSRGVYLDNDAFDDELYRLQMTYQRGIYSHGTALFLHDITDITPLYYTMTFPTGYNVPSLKNRGVTSFYVNKLKHALGIITLSTNQGRPIRTYNRERSIVDILRNRNQLDSDMVIQALRSYVNRSDRDLITLMEYAKTFKVSRVLQERIEVLL